MVCPDLLISALWGDVGFHLGFLLMLWVGFEFPILVVLSLFMGDGERLKKPCSNCHLPRIQNIFLNLSGQVENLWGWHKAKIYTHARSYN